MGSNPVAVIENNWKKKKVFVSQRKSLILCKLLIMEIQAQLTLDRFFYNFFTIVTYLKVATKSDANIRFYLISRKVLLILSKALN